MSQSASLAVVGGDVRQAHLAALLHADGHTVRTFALERHPPEGCTPANDPRTCFAGVQAVILPLPVQHGDAQLNAPLSNAPHPLADVLDAIPADTLTLAGSVPFWVHARAVQNNLRLTDYLSRDELAFRNAVPVSFAKSTAQAQQKASPTAGLFQTYIVRSVMRLPVKVACHMIGFQDIDKRMRVDFANCAGNLLNLVACNDRIDHIPFLAIVQAGAAEQRRAMMRGILDLLVNLHRTVGDDKQRCALETQVQHVDNLCGSKLEDNRIQRTVPAEQQARDHQHHTVAEKDIIPCVHAEPLAQRNRYKVRAAARRAAKQAQADCKAVKNTAENANQQDIVRNRHRWDQVGQHA